MNFWQNKIVILTGASRGLGACLSRHLVAAGAQVQGIARDPHGLEVFQKSLGTAGPGKFQAWSADLVDSQEAARVVAEITQTLGGCDALINNVGASTRVALAQCAPVLFQEQMALNFFTAVNTTQAALPSLLAARGRVVNIASLAAKTPWRWVAPYVTSKAALAAYSDQLRFELPQLHSVTLVCPGPLTRADAGERYNAQAAELQGAARRPAAGAKLSGIDPDVLAEKILKAAALGRRELVVPRKAAWLFAISAWSPRCGDWLRRRFESRSSD